MYHCFGVNCGIVERVKYRRHIGILVHKHRELILLVIIFGIGLWFRLSNISLYVWQLMGYDESRDMLVARHIVEYGDTVWRGPFASGSLNLLMNSPAYYYFMAALWFVGRSSVAMLALWSLLLASIMYLGYRLGTYMWDSKLGIIIAMLFAVQPTLVSNSRHISQPYLLPFFSLLFLVAYWKKLPITPFRLCVLAVLILMPLHFHYGSLLMLPAIGMWLGIEWIRLLAKRDYGWIEKVAPVLVTQYFILIWAWFTYWQKPFDQQDFFLNEVSRNWTSVVAQMQQAVIAMLDNLWWSKDPGVVMSILACFVGITLWHFHTDRKDPVTRKKYWWMVLFAVVPPVVAGLHGDIVHTSYMLSVLPLHILIIAMGIRVIMVKNRYIALMCLLLVVGVFTEQALTVNAEAPRKSYYQQFQEVAVSLYNDYVLQEPEAIAEEPRIALAALAGRYLPQDRWGTGALWYFLEDYFDRRLVRLHDDDVNFAPIIEKPRYFYVLCDYRGFARGEDDTCIQRFRSARTYLMDNEEKVYTSEVFDLWRFRIDETQPVKSYNVMYPRTEM